MNLNNEQQEYIIENYKKLSARQLAKMLGVSRSDIEKFIQALVKTASKKLVSEGYFIPKLKKQWLALILFALTFATYSNSLFFDFVYDDKVHLMENQESGTVRPEIKDLSMSGIKKVFSSPLFMSKGRETAHYRPVQNLSYMLNYKFSGLDPLMFHLWNILFQCAAAILLFLVLFELLADKVLAFWVAAFFSVHPVQIAAVTYVAGRSESIAFALMLGALYFFRHSLKLSQPLGKMALFLITSSVFYLLSLMTKELMIMAPLMFCLYAKVYGFKLPKISIPVYVAAVVLYWMIRIKVFGGGGHGGTIVMNSSPLFERPAIAAKAVVTYVKLIFIPSGLHMGWRFVMPRNIYEDKFVVLGFFVSAALIFITWFLRKNKNAFFGLLWFWLFLIPVLNLFVELNGPMAEHWLYVPIIGFLIAFIGVWLSPKVLRWVNTHVKEGILASLLILYAAITFHSNVVWKDEISLYKNIVKYSPMLGDIHTNLGMAYFKRGMNEEGKKEMAEAIKNNTNALAPVVDFKSYE